MPKKGYISEVIGGGRIVSHGQVSDLSRGFKLPDGVPFTVYIRPRFSVSTPDTVLSVKLYQEDGFEPAPVAFNDWSPLVISEIAPDTELLKTNDLFWGSGQSVDNGEGAL